MNNFFKGKSVIIFGGGSFIAESVINHLIEFEASKIICLDNSEDKIFWIKQKHKNNDNVLAILGDVNSPSHFSHRLPDFDYAIYMAATKHVGLSEESPEHAISVNASALSGIKVICREKKCQHFIYVSSDKAVNPTNVMGASKLLGEKLTLANSDSLICSVVRFGNVICSPGSISRIIDQCAKEKKPLNLRGNDTTRFFMTKSEAARLILAPLKIGRGGEIFIMKMLSCSVRQFSEAYAKAIDATVSFNFSSLDLGEKSYEELINSYEIDFARKMDDFIVVDHELKHQLPRLEDIKSLNSTNIQSFSQKTLERLTMDAVHGERT